jgi:hypothetical protein
MIKLLREFYRWFRRDNAEGSENPNAPIPMSDKEYEQLKRKMLIGIYGQNHKHKSFLNTHGDIKASHLGTVYERLLTNDTDLKDEEIIAAYKATSPFVTNSIYSAEAEFSSIATLCYFRPQLTEMLLENGILAMIASFGENLSGEDVVSFVRYNLLRENAEPYIGLPHSQGIGWLTNTLPSKISTIEEVMRKAVIKNRIELDKL